jgi:hypothetical protein
MTKIYVRTTKKILTGSLKDMVVSNVIEVPNEEVAQRMVGDCPKGSEIGGGWLGPKAVVLAHDYVVEEQ